MKRASGPQVSANERKLPRLQYNLVDQKSTRSCKAKHTHGRVPSLGVLVVASLNACNAVLYVTLAERICGRQHKYYELIPCLVNQNMLLNL
jgi:hypothetical protein